MIKYIVTRINTMLVSAKYTNGKCDTLYIQGENNILGNIYLTRVEKVVKNINCAFVHISKDEKCYYSLADNKRHLFFNVKNNDKVNESDYILAQVCKEAIKTKPPTVTSKIELPGKYIVLCTDVKGVHISGKTKNNINCKAVKERILTSNLEQLMKKLGFGFIVRSCCSTKSECINESIITSALEEANSLASEYSQIINKATYSKAPLLIYKSIPEYIKQIRNITSDDLSEIITDDEEVFVSLERYLVNEDKKKIRFYKDELLPLYKLYDIQKQIHDALSKKVWLKCGGYLIIEQTEALTVVDVNSGKCTCNSKSPDSVEKTSLKVNSEACMEIANQLRIRNISGIIIIDFINMSDKNNDNVLLDILKKEFKKDSITTNVVDITPLGLVEVTRKREGKNISELVKDFDDINL